MRQRKFSFRKAWEELDEAGARNYFNGALVLAMLDLTLYGDYSIGYAICITLLVAVITLFIIAFVKVGFHRIEARLDSIESELDKLKRAEETDHTEGATP